MNQDFDFDFNMTPNSSQGIAADPYFSQVYDEPWNQPSQVNITTMVSQNGVSPNMSAFPQQPPAQYNFQRPQGAPQMIKTQQTPLMHHAQAMQRRPYYQQHLGMPHPQRTLVPAQQRVPQYAQHGMLASPNLQQQYWHQSPQNHTMPAFNGVMPGGLTSNGVASAAPVANMKRPAEPYQNPMPTKRACHVVGNGMIPSMQTPASSLPSLHRGVPTSSNGTTLPDPFNESNNFGSYTNAGKASLISQIKIEPPTTSKTEVPTTTTTFIDLTEGGDDMPPNRQDSGFALSQPKFDGSVTAAVQGVNASIDRGLKSYGATLPAEHNQISAHVETTTVPKGLLCESCITRVVQDALERDNIMNPPRGATMSKFDCGTNGESIKQEKPLLLEGPLTRNQNIDALIAGVQSDMKRLGRAVGTNPDLDTAARPEFIEEQRLKWTQRWWREEMLQYQRMVYVPA